MVYCRITLWCRAIVSISFIFLRRVWSWIPPHPKSTLEWESVHDLRRRLNQPFNYTTSRYVHAEMCRYLTEEECKESDLMMQEHVKAHKALQKQVRKNPNLGTINVLVLMVRFSDHEDRDLISKSDVEEFWQTKVPEWLDVNSQGRYDIKATVINWQTTDNTEEYYSFGKRGTVREAQQMAWPILDDLDSRPNWDWSQYDLDENGRLDSIVIIHSGYGAETTTVDCFGAEMNNRIWAHAFSAGSRDTWKSSDGSVRVNGYTIASAFDGDCGTVPAKIGLTAHEYMHTLGLVDLYDGVNPLTASGIGAFDIMAYPYGQSGDADNPGHLSVYSKILAEWVEPKEIDSAGEFTLKASEISDEAYRITLADYGIYAEYLLVENRQPLEFDINIWSEGLVIYHIDDNADLQENLGYPGQDGWPENGNHYQVAVLPKDGDYDLEKGTNIGDAGDFWVPGDTLGPSQGGAVYPSTDTYGSGVVQETGLWLTVLSQAGTDVTFEVGGFDGEAATPSPTSKPTIMPTVSTPPPTSKPTIAPTVSTPPPTSKPTIAPTVSTPIPTTQNPTVATPIPTTQNPTVATQSPTSRPSPSPTILTSSPTVTPAMAPVASTGNPTSLSVPPTTTNPSPSPTQFPTNRPPDPTLGPTETKGTGSPTPAPANTNPTVAPSPSAATNPTVTSPNPTVIQIASGPTLLPFGSHNVTLSPTRSPGSSSSYLSSFGPYVGSPTSVPRETQPLPLPVPSNPVPTDLTTSTSSPVTPYLSNFGRHNGPTSSSYLSDFGGAGSMQLSPPQEEEGVRVEEGDLVSSHIGFPVRAGHSVGDEGTDSMLSDGAHVDVDETEASEREEDPTKAPASASGSWGRRRFGGDLMLKCLLVNLQLLFWS